MIQVIGARGTIQNVDEFLKKIHGFAADHQVVVQVLNAEMVFGKQHLISAVEHALRAVRRKTHTTNSLGMELLLYAAGERQLKLAIPKMGVKKGENKIAMVFVDALADITEATQKLSESQITELLELLSLEKDDTVLNGNEETLRKFGIREEELQTVTKAKYGDLILEKVAMVDIIK